MALRLKFIWVAIVASTFMASYATGGLDGTAMSPYPATEKDVPEKINYGTFVLSNAPTSADIAEREKAAQAVRPGLRIF